MPAGRKIAYANPVSNYRPRKDDHYNSRLTIGGDKILYPSDSGSNDATLLEAKIIFNSVISTPGSPFICADIKDYLFVSPWNTSHTSKYISSGSPKKYESTTIYNLLLNLTDTCIEKYNNVCKG